MAENGSGEENINVKKCTTTPMDKGQNLHQQEAHGPHRSPEKTVIINKHIRLS